MILCVTLNSCLDKTLVVPEWKPGDQVRGTSVREVVGGKGNNVARALKRLGREARPATFLGGSVGDRCESLLKTEDGFVPLVVKTEHSTREILTVRNEDSKATAFFDPDPTVSEAEAETLLKAVEQALAAGDVEAITLSGSSPSESTHGLFSDMIALAKARRVPAFLDTYGPSLDAIWGFWPDLIQLNRREAGLLLRSPDPTENAVRGLLQKWAKHGVKVAVVTDGPGVVIAQVDGQLYRAIPPKIEPVNPIGSGDCLLAGLVAGCLEGIASEALLAKGVSAAVANALVWDAGAIDAEEAQRIEGQIIVQKG